MTGETYTGNILVTDVDRGSGVVILRSLAKQGWRVFAASKQNNAVGFWSRYCAGKFVYPSPAEDPQAFVQSIKKYVQENQIDLIIPVTDEVILPLSQSRQEFETLCKIAMAEPDALDVVTNKMKTLGTGSFA